MHFTRDCLRFAMTFTVLLWARCSLVVLLETVEVQFFLVQSHQSLEQSSKWCGISSVGKCFQGKIGHALEGVLFYAGFWGFYSSLTSDQLTGLFGLMSRAEDQGKGKRKGNNHHSCSSKQASFIVLLLRVSRVSRLKFGSGLALGSALDPTLSIKYGYNLLYQWSGVDI